VKKTPQSTPVLETDIPRSPAALVWRMVKPHRAKSFWFFFLTFLGILAWTASPLMIAKIITELSKNPHRQSLRLDTGDYLRCAAILGRAALAHRRVGGAVFQTPNDRKRALQFVRRNTQKAACFFC